VKLGSFLCNVTDNRIGPHDALDLLYKAATDSPGHKRTTSNISQMSPMLGNNGLNHQPSPRRSHNDQYQTNYMPPPEVRREAVIDPALASEGLEKPSRLLEPGYKDAIKAWSRFRFVRAGWFTPAEAIDYID
jgi:hypothetical protein